MSGPRRDQNAVEASVVIPAFNAADTLGEQLQALAAQKVSSSYEVLVCDNGSTDGTAELARTWQSRLPNLRVLDASARRGPSAARNTGARAARGALILFCDADDVVGEGWLAAMSEGLQEADLVAGSLEGRLLTSHRSAALSWTAENVYTKPFLPRLRAASTNNLGIRRHVFAELGGFEEALTTNEDTDLCWRVQLAGYRFAHRPEAVVHVRKRDGLRAIFRQAYTYGAGDRNLRSRYSLVIDVLESNGDTPVRPGPARFDTDNFTRRAWAKLRRIRRPADLADQVWRVGFWLGDRRGPYDPAIPRVSPPDEAPV